MWPCGWQRDSCGGVDSGCNQDATGVPAGLSSCVTCGPLFHVHSCTNRPISQQCSCCDNACDAMWLSLALSTLRVNNLQHVTCTAVQGAPTLFICISVPAARTRPNPRHALVQGSHLLVAGRQAQHARMHLLQACLCSCGQARTAHKQHQALDAQHTNAGRVRGAEANTSEQQHFAFKRSHGLLHSTRCLQQATSHQYGQGATCHDEAGHQLL